MIKKNFYLNYRLSTNAYLNPEAFLFVFFWSCLYGFHFMNYYYGLVGDSWNAALHLTLLNIIDIPITLIYFYLWLPFMLSMMRYDIPAPILWIAYTLGMIGLAWTDGFLFSEMGNWFISVDKELSRPLNHQNLSWQYNFPEAILSMLSYESVMFVKKLSRDKNKLELLQDNMKKNYENLLLRHAMEENEVQQLRFLIDRHTLLNMMDSIYFAKELDSAQEIALKVKSLMSYALKESDTRKVSLVSEIEVLNDYIDLKRLEFTNRNVTIDLDVTNVDEQWMIAPFLLFVFVENVFKHGIHKLKNERWAKIRIEMRGSELHFQTLNKEPAQNVSDMPDVHRSGKGIRLTRRRLKTLYPEKHSLDLKSNHNVFEAYLTIDLAETHHD
jgi:two-component system, LytTR family, sensor kinase